MSSMLSRYSIHVFACKNKEVNNENKKREIRKSNSSTQPMHALYIFTASFLEIFK